MMWLLELKPGPLERHPVFLTTKPSLLLYIPIFGHAIRCFIPSCHHLTWYKFVNYILLFQPSNLALVHFCPPQSTLCVLTSLFKRPCFSQPHIVICHYVTWGFYNHLCFQNFGDLTNALKEHAQLITAGFTQRRMKPQ